MPATSVTTGTISLGCGQVLLHQQKTIGDGYRGRTGCILFWLKPGLLRSWQIQICQLPFLGGEHERMEPELSEGSIRYALGVGGPLMQQRILSHDPIT